MNLNSSPPPFPVEEINGDHDQLHQALDFGPYYQVLSSSSSTSASSHIFFNSTQDRVGFYHHQSYRPHHQEDDNYSYHGAGSSYEIKNRVDNGLKLTLWKNEDQGTVRSVLITNDDNNLAKRVSLKTKTKNPHDIAPTVSIATAKIEVQKLQPYSSSFQTDLNSNSSSYNSNIPIRVCSDCHTTKTPLWRSGPKGPKSLCNACGIRQRKARRAMAAAANDTAVVSTQPRALKTKVQYKEKMGKNGHSSQFKKRCQKAGSTATASSGSSGKKKLGFEDFLINLSKKFSFQRVFPQDEKDAAILLMALSSGLVHG